jgi:hypothetical protein
MKKYHVKVAVQTLEIYEIEAENPQIAQEDWGCGKLIDADDEALESIVLSVEEV